MDDSSDPNVAELIARLREKNLRLFVAATGAGSGIQDALWLIPGCSSFFVGAVFPYAQHETDNFLGFKPEKYCSPETAMDLAMTAYMRACDGSDAEPIGLGLTASVASLTEHRGDHRVHVTVVTSKGAFAANLTLRKGVGLEQRMSDGEAADAAGLALILGAAGVMEMPEDVENVTEQALDQFMKRPYFDAEGRRKTESEIDMKRVSLFPGAFNPPHPGHFGMAQKLWATKVAFNITTNPPHKDALGLGEILRRAVLLKGYHRFFTKGVPLYIEKARRWPGVRMLIGVDAVVRMLDPKWGPEIEPMLAEFAQLKTCFVVFGRLIDEKFVTMFDVYDRIPEKYHHLFSAIEGRWDISSSEIRAGRLSPGEAKQIGREVHEIFEEARAASAEMGRKLDEASVARARGVRTGDGNA